MNVTPPLVTISSFLSNIWEELKWEMTDGKEALCYPRLTLELHPPATGDVKGELYCTYIFTFITIIVIYYRVELVLKQSYLLLLRIMERSLVKFFSSGGKSLSWLFLRKKTSNKTNKKQPDMNAMPIFYKWFSIKLTFFCCCWTLLSEYVRLLASSDC